MSRPLILISALLAALAAGALAVSLSTGSSHREAPLTSMDPTADDTDVYAFTARDAPGSLTVVANWLPFQDPGGGPNFYKFDPRARYYVNVDNTGDGAYDVRYRFTFRTIPPNTADAGYPVALPPISSLDDPKLERQRMTIVRETYGPRGRLRSSRTVGRDLPVAPSNIGKKTMPNYEALAGQAVRSLRGGRPRLRGPAGRPVSSSRSTASSTRSTSRAPGRATWAAASTRWPATESSRSSCRCPRHRSRATATPSRPPRPPTPWSACGPRPSVGGCR